MKTINNYEILNHGINYPDYFTGCGVSFTESDCCVTGIGDTEKEAFEDALEQLAQMDYAVTGIEHLINDFSDESICANFTEEDLAVMEELPYYYISIRVN